MALEQLPVEQKETMLPGCIEDMSYQERLLWGFIASRKNIFAGVVPQCPGSPGMNSIRKKFWKVE